MTNNKWEKFAKNFEEANNYVVGISDIQIVKEKLTALPEVGDLLELGCGNGTYTECFIQSATKIIATDISEEMVSVTKKKFNDVKTVQVEKADCFKLQYSDASFDTVFMANLLHVIPNQDIALAECFRVLKKGGKLVIISFTLHGMSFLNKLLLKYRYAKTYGIKSSSNIILTKDNAKEMVASAGFQVNETEIIGVKVKAIYLTAMKNKS